MEALLTAGGGLLSDTRTVQGMHFYLAATGRLRAAASQLFHRQRVRGSVRSHEVPVIRTSELLASIQKTAPVGSAVGWQVKRHCYSPSTLPGGRVQTLMRVSTMIAEAEPALRQGPGPSGGDAGLEAFREAAAAGANLVPLFQRILSDHLTPVLAYRCLVREDERTAPSFLFESVINGDQQASSRHAAPSPSTNCVRTYTRSRGLQLCAADATLRARTC